MITTYLWVGLGGFLGANARYLVGQWAAANWGVTFPYGTLIVNLTGSFILCLLLAILSGRNGVVPALRLVFIVGFLGSYTTFSTFSNEWIQLLDRGEIGRALGYLLSSVAGGGIAGGAGLIVGRMIS